MITRFRVQNYKALRDVTLDLTRMHLLIGPNDSGKTSILEAIAALCRSADHDLNSAFSGAWSGQSLVWHGADEPIVRTDVSFDDMSRYQLAVTFAPSVQKAIPSAESVTTSASEELGPQLIQHPMSGLYFIVHQNNASTIPQQDFKHWQSAYDQLKGMQFYRWVPQHLALPVAPDVNRRFRMEPSGFGLALCLDDILGYDRNRFSEIEDRFKSIFPQIESIKLIAEPAYKAPVDNPKQVLMLKQSDGKGIHFQFRDSSKLVSASQVSDGVLLVLAYLAILHLPEPPRVLLVEEPENGIHPARLKEVLTILRDLVAEQDHTQVILTSHSPYVVSMFEPEEVTLCHKGDDGAVEVRRLSDSKSVQEQMDFFTLGEIWTLEGDEALLEAAQESPAAP